MPGFNRLCRSFAFVVSAALVPTPYAAHSQGSPPAAASSASEPSATNPLLAPTPEELGDSLVMHQRYQAAIEAYKKGPQESASLWNKLGIAYQMMLNLNDAMHCYQRSLKINPRNTHVLNNLATVYDAMKRYRQAEHMYRKALKIAPGSALIEKNLGTDLLAQRKYKEGWEAYQIALALDPRIFEHNGPLRVDNPASVQERGAMNYYMAKGCVRAGETDRAIEYLRMALNEGFTNPKKIVEDSEFASLRGVPAFEQLLAEQRLQ